MNDDEIEAALEKEFETRNYSKNLDLIPQWVRDDGVEILVLLKTGDNESPISRELATWDDTMGQWHGAWRNTTGDGSFAHAEPFAWCFPNDIDEDILAEFGLNEEADALA